MLPSSPLCVEVETKKKTLWKKYNDVISDTTGLDTTCHDIEKTRQLLYEYAGKGLVEKLDDAFLEKAASVIDIGDDKVRTLQIEGLSKVWVLCRIILCSVMSIINADNIRMFDEE